MTAGDEGQRTLQFFADRVEGNLLAAHQEIQKLALLYPAGELALRAGREPPSSTWRATTCSSCPRPCWPARPRASLRMLDGLQAEGEAEVLVHYTLAEDIRALKRVKDAMARRPAAADGAARAARLGRQGARSSSAPCTLISESTLAHLLDAAHVCDGLVKGLKHPDWPLDRGRR